MHSFEMQRDGETEITSIVSNSECPEQPALGKIRVRVQELKPSLPRRAEGRNLVT